MKIDSSYLSDNSQMVKYNKEENNVDSFKLELEKAMDDQDKDKLKEVCQNFESIFLNMMFKEMRSSIPENDLIPKSMALETFEGMLDEKIADNGAKSNSIGLANSMYSQLVNNMENTYKFPSEIDKVNEQENGDDE